jgi:hypothetical protein
MACGTRLDGRTGVKIRDGFGALGYSGRDGKCNGVQLFAIHDARFNPSSTRNILLADRKSIQSGSTLFWFLAPDRPPRNLLRLDPIV